MKFEEIRGCPGSYEIELGENDIVQAGEEAEGKFYGVTIRYEKVVKPGDAHMKGYAKRLFENEDLRLVGYYSSYNEFDGKLLSVLLFRKTGDT